MDAEQSQFGLHFVGVGPQRTGSSWLHEVLDFHPSLSLPSGVKETMFFDRYFDKGIGWYESHFARSPQQLCGEIGPTYFGSEQALERLYNHNADCKIIINIRNPVEHAFSVYMHDLSKGRVNGALMDAAQQEPDFLRTGHYAQFIPRWQQKFGEANVAYVWMDEIKGDPQLAYRELCTFLGISNQHYPNEIGSKKINVGKQPRFPLLSRYGLKVYYLLREYRLHSILKIAKFIKMDKITFSRTSEAMPSLSDRERAYLLSLYETDIAFLESKTGRDLSEWRKMPDND